MKKYRKKRKEEIIVMHSHFLNDIIVSGMLSRESMVYPHNCSEIITIGSPNNLRATDFLKGYAILNFCYYGNKDLRANTFMKSCTKQVTTRVPSIEKIVRCIKRRNIDPYDSKKLNDLFDNYLNSKKSPSIREKIEYKRKQDLYHCLVYKERYSMLRRHSFPDMKECFDQYYQPIENIPKNLKPLAILPNLDHSGPLLHLNQTNNSSTALITFITFVLSVIMLLFCKYANKFLHRNENMDRDLPVNQLRNRRVRKSNSRAQLSCLKLENCIRSCEQNCKRGY